MLFCIMSHNSPVANYLNIIIKFYVCKQLADLKFGYDYKRKKFL